jgi:hypothetical protein
VIARECGSVRRIRSAFNLCEADVSNEGQELGRQTELQARETIQGLTPKTRSISVTYKLAGDADVATLQSADIKGHLVGEDRIIFSELIPVDDFPPDPYVLRARVFASGQPVTTADARVRDTPGSCIERPLTFLTPRESGRRRSLQAA